VSPPCRRSAWTTLAREVVTGCLVLVEVARRGDVRAGVGAQRLDLLKCAARSLVAAGHTGMGVDAVPGLPRERGVAGEEGRAVAQWLSVVGCRLSVVPGKPAVNVLGSAGRPGRSCGGCRPVRNPRCGADSGPFPPAAPRLLIGRTGSGGTPPAGCIVTCRASSAGPPASGRAAWRRRWRRARRCVVRARRLAS
jgi:hypothetical protein